MTVEGSSMGYVVAALGEILWDMFPTGPRFGGAPANYVCHSASLGGRAWLVSAVGDDPLGKQALEQLRLHQVETRCVMTHNDYPTGAVQVTLDDQGHPRYEFGRDEAWDDLAWTDAVAELAARCRAVCFGTLGQRSPPSRRLIRQFVGAATAARWRILDVNLRAPFYDDVVIQESLKLANVLKLSDEELPVLARIFRLVGDPVDQIRKLAEQFAIRLTALTRGPDGALLVRGDEVSESAGGTVTVADTVGAGDAFTAALTIGLLRDLPLDAINQTACRVAEYVCSQSGATPRLPDELVREFEAT
jgi:fructokinase